MMITMTADEARDYLATIGLADADDQFLRGWTRRIIAADGVGYSADALAAARALTATALVKCGSHRAREKMLRLVGRENAQALFSMRRGTGTGGVYRIPAELAPAAKQITGVTGFRDGDDLHKCWPSPSMRELVSPD